MKFEPEIENILAGKSEHARLLLEYFCEIFLSFGEIRIEPTKTMIGISNQHKRIAWVTQLGKNFIHIVFPFDKPYEDNLCFQKVAQVPGSNQFNHHFRMLFTEDLNEEVRGYMKLAYRMGSV